MEKGQSLYGISKLYTVSLDEIYKFNPDLKTAGVKADQEIKIPYISSLLVIPSGTVSLSTNTLMVIDTTKYVCHKIVKSETVYSITRKYGITEKQLLAFNPGLTPALKEGSLLVVGEKQKRKPAPPKEMKEQKQNAVVKENKVSPMMLDSSLLKPVSRPKKTSYKVALMLPFKFDQTLEMDLNELVKTNSNFPSVPALACDFYLGFKRAVDSLKSNDFDLSLEVFDADDKDSLKFTQIIAEPIFKDLDFIVGPLYASGFKTVSKKAKEFHIPIVSPITSQNKILFNNTYISKSNPSQYTLLESLADYCIDSLVLNGANMILMAGNDKDKKEMGFISSFKKYYNERQKTLGKTAKDTVTVAKGIAGIKLAYKPNVKNVVVALTTNEVFIADFTTQLAMFADKKDVVLCGWQSISEMDNIDQEYLNQLHYVFPHQYNLSNRASYGHLLSEYKIQQDSYPGEYYFIGFDIGMYYLKNLKQFGPEFQHHLNTLNSETNYMRFKFARPDNSTGFDNRGVFIFRYANYQLQKTGWK